MTYSNYNMIYSLEKRKEEREKESVPDIFSSTANSLSQTSSFNGDQKFDSTNSWTKKEETERDESAAAARAGAFRDKANLQREGAGGGAFNAKAKKRETEGGVDLCE